MTPHNFYVAAKNLYKKISEVFSVSSTVGVRPTAIQGKAFSKKRHKKFRSRLKSFRNQDLKTIKENSVRELLEAYRNSQHKLSFSCSEQVLNRNIKKPFLRRDHKMWDKKFDHKSLITEILTDIQLMSI